MQAYWNDFYHGNWPVSMDRDVTLKAGEGVSFSDPRYSDFVREATAGGHDATAYYALHAGTPTEIDRQAHRAAGIIGRRPAMYDVEWWPKQSGSAAGIARLPAVSQAIDTYRRDGGVMHVIYLPHSMWERMGSPSLAPLVARGMHLINADYRRGSDVAGSAAWHSYGGMDVWAVQYAPCHNTARGTVADLRSVWATGAVVAPPNGPATEVYTVHAGDSLFSIAHDHGMTLDQIESMNPTAGHPVGNFDLIKAGDHITVIKR